MGVKRVVIKVGSNLLSTPEGFIDLSFISRLSYRIKKIMDKDIKVLLVSSGAVLCGAHKLGIKERPKDLIEKQTLASVGQAYLMHLYDQIFSNYDIKVGQILLTLDIFKDNDKFNNAKRTIENLLSKGVLPVVNENDTVAVSELIFGDNDFLAVYTAYMVEADMIVMLSSAGGLLNDKNEVIKDVKNIEDAFKYVKGVSSTFGTGGMRSKLEASRIASLMGIPVIITHKDEDIEQTINMRTSGTIVHPSDKPIKSRRRIVNLISQPKGIVYIDDGAVKAVKDRKSLLPPGVIYVEGNFNRGDVVNIADKEGNIVGRGKIQFSSDELKVIKGKKSKDVKKLIRNSQEEVIHADNIIVY